MSDARIYIVGNDDYGWAMDTGGYFEGTFQVDLYVEEDIDETETLLTLKEAQTLKSFIKLSNNDVEIRKRSKVKVTTEKMGFVKVK